MTARTDRTELLKLHDWDELLFGGFYCLHCTPDDEDPLDDPIAWPCQPLREAGVTDDEARALIEAHREKSAAEYEAKKRAEQAELQRRVDEFNARCEVGTPVFAYPGARPEDDRNATRLVTRTRSKASILGGHTDVVWVDGHSACIALSHVDPVSEEQFAEARAEETAAAVAAEGALPVPVGNQPQPLDDQRLAEIAARATSEHLTPGPWRLDRESCDCGDGYGCRHGDYVTGVVTPTPTEIALDRCKRTGEQPRDYDFHRSDIGDFTDADWELMAHARRDVPDLLAEIQRLKAELAKYVGVEPTIAEEMAYLSRSVEAVTKVCDKAERQARRWENPLPVPEWVGAIRQALELAPTTDRAEEA